MSGLEPNGLGRTRSFSAVSADRHFTEARGPKVVVHETPDGRIVADGPDGSLAEGDMSTPADVTTVLQSAIDEGGNVTVQAASQNYSLGVQGTDKEDAQYCLRMRSDTDLEIKGGATLYYNAQNTDASSSENPDVSTPILCEAISNFRIHGHGTIDAGCHPDNMSDTRGSGTYNVMCVKIGIREDTRTGSNDTGCTDWDVEDLTITGAYRHGVESIDYSKRGNFRNLLLDDASGDDDVSISGHSEWVDAIGCTSINKRRVGGWSEVCFEIEDGASHCYCHRCVAIEPTDAGGFLIGKQHGGYSEAEDIGAINCATYGSNQNGLSVFTGRGTIEDINIVNFRGINNDSNGILCHFGDAAQPTIRDLTIEEPKCYGNGQNGLALGGGNSDGMVDDARVIKPKLDNNDAHQMRVTPSSGGEVFKDLEIEEPTLKNSTSAYGITFGGDATNYQGISFLEGARFEGIDWDEINFNVAGIRQFVICRDNEANYDWSGLRPQNPYEGLEYYGDGNHSSSGTKAKWIYANGGWHEIWAL